MSVEWHWVGVHCFCPWVPLVTDQQHQNNDGIHETAFIFELFMSVFLSLCRPADYMLWSRNVHIRQ